MPKPMDPYYHNERSDLLPLVPEGIRRTLDVGCSSGAFAALLKEKRGVEAWGVEEVPEVAALAEPRLDKVLVGQFEAVYDQLPRGAFDLVSFNDVLEHMAWPDRVLEQTIPLLSPTGCVVASIPNVRYWHNLYHLWVEQDFNYEDSGIRDRTHLRFFTKKSALRMFETCGYDVDEVVDLHRTRSKALRLLVILSFGKHMDCYPLQFGIRARPKRQ